MWHRPEVVPVDTVPHYGGPWGVRQRKGSDTEAGRRATVGHRSRGACGSVGWARAVSAMLARPSLVCHRGESGDPGCLSPRFCGDDEGRGSQRARRTGPVHSDTAPQAQTSDGQTPASPNRTAHVIFANLHTSDVLWLLRCRKPAPAAVRWQSASSFPIPPASFSPHASASRVPRNETAVRRSPHSAFASALRVAAASRRHRETPLPGPRKHAVSWPLVSPARAEPSVTP